MLLRPERNSVTPVNHLRGEPLKIIAGSFGVWREDRNSNTWVYLSDSELAFLSAWVDLQRAFNKANREGPTATKADAAEMLERATVALKASLE